MINIAHILSLPPDERDLEIRKLIVPKPWKHDTYGFSQRICSKCGKVKCFRGNSCPFPDRIDLDWNLAMKMRDEAVEEDYDAWINAKDVVCQAELSNNKGKYRSMIDNTFMANFAQPCHFLLAAVLAKKNE